MSLASVLSQISPFSGAKVRHSCYVGNQNDAAPYSFARPRRCWRECAAEYSVFCTVRDGVPQENTAVFSKFMQSAAGIMQTDEADSIGWCNGFRFACTQTGSILGCRQEWNVPKCRLDTVYRRKNTVRRSQWLFCFGLVYNSFRKKKCGRLPSPSDVGLTKVFERVCLYGRIRLILVGLYL